MNKKILLIGAALVFIVGSLVGNFGLKMFQQPPEPSNEAQALIGSAVPSFSLKAMDGVKENSSQWLGKVQVINFWATWCPPCIREIPLLIEMQNRFADDGLVIIGIAMDHDPQVAAQYAEEHGVNFLILDGSDDEAMSLAVEFGNDMGLLPYTAIIDRSGNISHIKYGEVDRRTLEREIKKLL